MARIAYFRAENSAYTYVDSTNTTVVKSVTDTNIAKVCPAIDTRLSNPATPVWTWVNPQSFQIFSSGLDCTYSSLVSPSGQTYPTDRLMFPSGGNYDPTGHTYDDITNFSGGTLESAMP